MLGSRSSKGSSNELKHGIVVKVLDGVSDGTQSCEGVSQQFSLVQRDENLCPRDDELNNSKSCNDLESLVNDVNAVAIGGLELESKNSVIMSDGSGAFIPQGIESNGVVLLLLIQGLGLII